MRFCIHSIYVMLCTCALVLCRFCFFFNDTPTTEIYTLSYTTLFRSTTLLKLLAGLLEPDHGEIRYKGVHIVSNLSTYQRSEEHTSELQSLRHLVCRLLLEKKKHCRTQQISSYILRRQLHVHQRG